MKTPIAGGSFDASHPKALAVYCSDGRFTQAVEDLARGLGHERIDTLTLPGGPGLLNLSTACYSDHDALGRAIGFLVHRHSIEELVLVAHAGCGYYRSRFSMLSPALLEEHQRADLGHAERWVSDRWRGVRARSFYARGVDAQITFSPLDPAR